MTTLSNPLDGFGATQGVPTQSQLDSTQPAQGGRDTTYRPAWLVWTDPASQAQAFFFFDCVKEESHVRDALICEHTVETGVNIVDHVRPQPDELTLEGIVTNHPIESPDAQVTQVTINIPPPKLQISESLLLDLAAQAVGLAPKFPDKLVLPQITQFTSFTDYVANAYATLTSVRDQAILITAHTPRAMYTSMVLKGITMTRSTAIGAGAAKFRLQLRQIRVVSSSIGAAPAPTVVSASPTQNVGAKNTTPDSSGDQSSVAWKLAHPNG
jgi:hypothetical protein